MNSDLTNESSPARSDYSTHCQGSIYLVCPHNYIALQFLRQHVRPDSQWLGNNLVVEHRFICELAQALTQEGFTVR